MHLQTLVTRQRNPLDAGVISVTSIHGGSATNIIPEIVELKGTLRSFSDEWRWKTLKLIEQNSTMICSLHGVECSFEPVIGYPPLVNNETATIYARSQAEILFGRDCVKDFEPKMWAEDFAFYAQQIPACFWMLGVRPIGDTSMPGLHNSRFAPDESALKFGTSMLASTAVNWLKKIIVAFR